jgi:hypothetical protein
MDIYKQAKETNADYYDFNTGYTYLIQRYNREIEQGIPTPGILVKDSDGIIIGVAKRKE